MQPPGSPPAILTKPMQPRSPSASDNNNNHQSPRRPNVLLDEATLLKHGLQFALMMIFGSFFIGILAEQGLIRRRRESPPHVPDWQLIRDGYSPSLVVDPWEASTSPFLPLCILVIVLATWRLARVAADRMFDQQPPGIRAKCGNYMLEIFSMTIGLAWRGGGRLAESARQYEQCVTLKVSR